MFDWNLGLGAPKSSFSMDMARELAGSIASNYLSSGHSPNESLEKIAVAEELTPHQIHTVAAEANKAIHTAKYAGAGDKYHAADFPLCDAQAVLTAIQSAAPIKLAGAFVEPKVANDFDPFQAFGVKAETLDKTASVKSQLKTASVRGELVDQKLRDRVFLTKEAAVAAEQGAIKLARQMALDGANSAERLQTLGYVYKFAQEAKMEKVAKPILAKLAYVLKGEGMLEPRHAKVAMEFFMAKEADQKAPAELISPDLVGKVMVVNGQHPLYIRLKTLEDCSEKCDSSMSELKTVEDRLQMVRQKIREL